MDYKNLRNELILESQPEKASFQSKFQKLEN